MSKPRISINLVVLNGATYLSRCLESIEKQTIPPENIEINILDNGSTDSTIPTLEKWVSDSTRFYKVDFTKGSKNLGMWGGQEELLKQTESDFVVFLSVDVILAPNFIAEAVHHLEKNPTRGGLQGKIYQYRAGGELTKNRIDTCGFTISRSRRIGNIGHGEEDAGQFDQPREIFGVEGAVPVFRTEALRSIRVAEEIADHDLFWYAEDLDVAWRMRLAGWSQHYVPSLIAWHDRQTTKRTRSTFKDFVAIRKEIPLRKRRLEWRNIRCTIVKNDYIINILRDLPYLIPREVAMCIYLLFFEPAVLTEVFSLIRLFPRMLHKRWLILSQAKVGPGPIHSYFS